jgi:hypothetical protein
VVANVVASLAAMRWSLPGVVLGLALCGCGGSTAAGADAAASDAPAPDGASSDLDATTDAMGFFGDDAALGGPDVAHVPLVACPPSPPEAGTPCSVPEEGCEYGTSFAIWCDQVMRCTFGTWKTEFTGDGCPFEDGGACPATFSEALALEAGVGSCPAFDCQYPEGFCECLTGCGGGALLPALPTGDWQCRARSAGCPSPRPRVGTPCETDAGVCMYGWACSCGETLQCEDGVWAGDKSPPCP